MKKLFTLLLCSTFFGVTTNAATYYVNIGLATGLNNGTSWPNAYQTFAAGITAATNNAGVDDVYIKGTPPTGTSVWSMSVDNYYGSFAGTESTPADRPMNDNDGNGIIEPWEFKYPTVYLFNYNNTAINGSAAILDGFTITHGTTGTPSTVSGSSAMTTLISPIGQTVQNCVFTGSNLSYTSYTNSNGGCLLKVLGTFQNNLIEKNNVSITYGATDIKITPILDVNCPATGSANPTPAVSINGCIFRNNIVTISNTSGTAVTNLKGIILNITANDPAATVVINNCLVYNNEANYTGGGSNSTAGRASIAGSLNFSTSYTSDKYVNCLFANNKMVNLLSCMHVMANTHVIHKGYNNAFWNNQNNSLAVSVTSSSAQISGCIFDNNYLDAANTGSWGNGIWGANNQTNLSKSNTGANSPLFKNPPLNSGANIIGANQTSGNADYTAINQSDWRITATTSYLYHIGAATATTGISTDKAGYAFIAATPSVGAYEATPLLTTSAVTTIASTSATSGGTISWDGGTTIATTGVCWSTSQNPTTANSKTTNGATSGTFTGNMTGLTAGTTYYVRAYATNTTHTAYGMQTSFTTTSTKPEPSNQATSFATGTITSSGIPLSFTAAATGSQAPDGYLVKMSSSSVSDPVDGTDPADLTALTASVANVKVTTSPISSFTSLTAGTLYHYKIYSYTNFGTDINFNTTSAPSLDVYTSTNPVTGATLTPTSSTTADISWTAASGYNSTNHSTLVFVKASGSAITLGTPTNAPSAYTASTVLTAGSTGTAYQGDASAYCVYNGDGTSVSITGLTGNTTYQVLVYTVVDASNTGSTNSYSSAATASGLTYKKEPVSSPTNFAKGTVSSSAISITWTASAINSQGPDGYLLIGKQGSSISTDPTDGTDQSDVTAFTSNLANVKVTSGTATSASSFTNMIAGTMYYYRIYPYTNSGTHIDYKTSNNADLHIATSPNPVTGINISSVDATNMTVNWTTPIGNSATNHGIYVFVKAASSITDGTPTNAGSTYTANTVFGSGAAYQNDASAYCVYKGDGNNVTISGLTVNTTYYVLIYSVYDNTTTNNSDLTNSYSLSSTTSVTTGNPIINGAATASAFTTTYGTASSAQTFSVSGSYLSTSIAANAPTGFEVSSDGTNYASLATIVRSGSVANGTLYIRLKADALVSGAYNAKDIALSSTTTTVNIVTSASGNVVTAKSLTITGTTTANKVYDGTTTATLTGGSLVGVISPDVLTLTQLGTYSDKNVGISKAITANCSISGVSASNYTLTQPTLTARDITVKAVTVTGVTAIKTYNGTTLSTGSPTVGTLASGDIVNVAPTQTYDNKNYGTSHVLTPFGLTIKDGSNADMTANYSITYTPSPSTGEIDKAAVTVTAVTATKTYDGTTSSAGSPTVGALVSGDVVNVAAIQTYDNKNYGTTHVLTPSGLTFKDGSNADMSGNYSITYTPSPATGVINKLALTVTGATTADKEYDGSTTASVTGGSLLGVVSPDAVTLTEAGDFDTKNVGTSKTITANCSIDGAGVGNYTLTQPTLTAKNITAKALTIGAASIASKVYDGSATSGTLTAGTLSGFVSHETITVSSAVGTYSDATVGTGKTATIVYTLANGTNGGLATNYSLANGSATGNITAATSIVDVTSSQNSSDVISGTTSEVTVKGSAVLTVNEASEVKSLATSTGTKVIVN
ncbi:MAG: YDG domain-containing protein, partial [Paludibacter sp.]